MGIDISNREESYLILRRALKSESIKIYIGERTPESTPHVVPKTVLCNKFRYFEKALSPNFKEGQNGILHFPDDNEDAWNLLLYYLFHDRVPRVKDVFIAGTMYLPLAHAYVLGDKYGLTTFQNEVVRAFMVALAYSWMEPDVIIEILGFVPVKSPLRQLVLEEIVRLVVDEDHGLHGCTDFEELGTYEGVFVELLRCFEMYSRAPKTFPPHKYGDNDAETKKYLVKEEEDD